MGNLNKINWKKYAKDRRTIVEIAKELHCNERTIKRYFKKEGLKKLQGSRSEISKRKQSKANIEEKNPAWKGNKAKYQAIHAWVRRYKPKVHLCESCGKKKILDATNISGEYKRDINDYKWLCRKCHIQFDNPKKGQTTLGAF